MTNEEFRAIRKQLAINQTELAERLRLSLRAVVYYESGQRSVPGPVAILMEAYRDGRL